MSSELERIETGLTPAQHAARATAVGASEVYDALFNPAELWLEKTGRNEPRFDDALSRLGNAIEPYIIAECVRARDLFDVYKPDTLRKGRMVAHLDSIAQHGGARGKVAVEAKWRGSRDGFGAEGTADVPQRILLQTTAQMHVAELRLALVPVLFLRPPVAIYDVPHDVELGNMIEAGVDRFWWHVEHDVAPEVNLEAPEAVDILRRLYPGTNGKRIQATPSLEAWRIVYHEAKESENRYEKAADVAKAHLLAALGECAELKFADGKVFRRKLVTVKGYTVEPREQIDARFVNDKEPK